MVSAAAYAPRTASIAARLDRLPPTSYFRGLVARIALGGWFEFYELFMPGFISLGLIKSGLYTATTTGFFDWSGFASFLASFFAGMFIGTILFSWVSDRYGRRSVFTYSMLWYAVCTLIVAFQSSPAVIDFWRFMAGFGVGVQLITNDTYISEITPKSTRGQYMAFGIVVILTSVPIVAFLSYLLVPHQILGLDGWRWVMIVGALGGILVWLVRRGLPESPRWLEAHGFQQEAERTLESMEVRVRAETGKELPAPEPAVEAAQERGSWTEMFGPRYLKRTVMLSIFQFLQTVGVFGFTAWVPILLAKQGFTVVHSLLYTAIIVLLTPVGGLLAMIFAERFERKWQLVGTAASVAVFGMLFGHAHSVGLILLFGACIALSNNWLIGIFHTYGAELFPTRIRAQAVGFSFSWSRVSSIFVGYWVAAILKGYGTPGVFLMIAAAMALIMLAVGIMGPRTNGQRLEVLSQ